jgi:hypothetical protein
LQLRDGEGSSRCRESTRAHVGSSRLDRRECGRTRAHIGLDPEVGLEWPSIPIRARRVQSPQVGEKLMGWRGGLAHGLALGER